MTMSTETAPRYPSNGYAYSYAFPPGAPQQPRPRVSSIRILIVGAAFITIVLGVILLFFYLVPFPDFPSFYVTAVSLSNFSAANFTVAGHWDCRFEVDNPSKKVGLSYDDVVSKLYYKSELLSSTAIAPFQQDKKNVTNIEARFSAPGSFIGDRALGSINEERMRRGTVKFNLKLEFLMGIRYGSYRTRKRYFRVWCNDVAVNATGGRSGNLVDGSKECLRY